MRTAQYYFAYGSNMDEGQMALRCPKAKLVGRASLADHSFLINERGVASVAAAPNRVVHGLLWTISRTDEKALDRYEGVGHGHYRKEVLPILQTSGCTVDALVYIASSNNPGIPRTGYMERINRTATEHGLPDDYIEELQSWLQTSKHNS
jgi:cation transport regulator ChaC